ncbi:hypothetical protein [Kitasatospora sp. NPDC088346]|uniref:hypothetical protein n=1 Tax=Kitasatospora sp. NPDC088346 TaxID=3364073 RepID=UPI0037F20159
MSARRRTGPAVLAALGVLAAGCSSAPRAVSSTAVRFDDSGVSVTLTAHDWNAAGGTLDVDLAPDESGFHLYSTDLPPEGVDGVGRPTAVRVDGVLAEQSPLAVRAEVRRITLAGSETPVPVYPDGPVHATLKLRASGRGTATVYVSYAACSEAKGCLMPVLDHPVVLTVDSHGVTAAG